MNRWFGIGQIIHTPQLTYAGTPRRTLRISVSTSELSEDGTEEIQFHNVALRGELADVWETKLGKMDFVGVVGEVTYYSSTRDGTKKRITEIIAKEIRIIVRNQDHSNGDGVPF